MADDINDSTIQPLPEDNDTPLSPPEPPANDTTHLGDARTIESPKLDDTHPALDSEIDKDEAYDEGPAAAAEASDPSAGNAVTGYEPDEDEGAPANE